MSRFNKIPVKFIIMYSEDDEDCMGDYENILLYIGEKFIEAFGDAYHDKGWDTATGYLGGLRSAFPDVFDETQTYETNNMHDPGEIVSLSHVLKNWGAYHHTAFPLLGDLNADPS